MEYLPEGYEELKLMKSYISLSKLPEGEHRFRIVQRPVAGWVDWKERKPYRYRPDSRPDESFDPKEPMRAFWACYVWEYTRGALFIVEITQSTILKSLTQFGKDEEWGDFTKYDIKIIKEGSGKETKYRVSPVPHKEMKEEILFALKQAPVKLEALYEGGDPWEVFPSVTTAKAVGVTREEAVYLDNLIGTDLGLRENILNFLKSNGYGDSLMKMPSAMYEKMVSRALINKQQRDEEEERNRKEMAPTLSSVEAIFPSAQDQELDAVMPF